MKYHAEKRGDNFWFNPPEKISSTEWIVKDTKKGREDHKYIYARGSEPSGLILDSKGRY